MSKWFDFHLTFASVVPKASCPIMETMKESAPDSMEWGHKSFYTSVGIELTEVGIEMLKKSHEKMKGKLALLVMW